MLVLGLDISTTVLGFCLLNKEGMIVEYGSVRLTCSDKVTPKEHFDRANVAIESIDGLFEKYEIKDVGVEAPMQLFKVGQSSADVIIKLACMNFAIRHSVYSKYDIAPTMLNVATARKKNGISIPQKHKDKKGLIIDWCVEKYGLVFSKKKTGKYVDGTDDACDAIIIARALLLDLQSP
jgi:hypothetical protein